MSRPKAWRTYRGRLHWLFDYIKAAYMRENETPTTRILSSDAGVSETYIGKMLAASGDRPKLPTVLKAAELGNVTVGWLANNEGWPDAETAQMYKLGRYQWDTGDVEPDEEQESAIAIERAERRVDIETRRAQRRAKKGTTKKIGKESGSRSTVRPTAGYNETEAMRAAKALPRPKRRT